MKKGNFKAALVAVLVAFTFLLAGVQSGHAQGLTTSTQPELYGPLKSNFVSSSEAQTLLETQLVQLKAYLQTLTPGSPTYGVTYRATVFYRAILTSVVGGKQVSGSIMDGIGMFTSTYFTGAPYTEKLGLREGAIDLLGTASSPNPNTN